MQKPPSSSQLAAKPAKNQVVGPFLGHRGRPGAIRICIGLPHRTEPSLACRLTDDSGHTVREQLCSTLHPAINDSATAAYRTFVFDFLDLPAGMTLAYAFFLDGHTPLDLEGDLSAEDCRFRVPGLITAASAIALVSCHNPFTYASGAAENGWTLWKQLHELIERDPCIELLVLGGDQVYNDDLEDEGAINRLGRRPNDTRLIDAIRRRLIRQYQLFWDNHHYRRVLARLPSVAMWDDHDITDGWGGRVESMRADGEFRPGWRRYFELCREAFVAYQGVRNPPQPAAFAALSPPVFTAGFELGDCRFLLLDLRSDKNLARRQVLSPAHAAAVQANIAATGDHTRRLFVLTPVVPLRTNFAEDQRLGFAAGNWREFQLKLDRHPWLHRVTTLGARFGWLAPASVFLLMPTGLLWMNAAALGLGMLFLVLWLAVAALHWAEHFTFLPQLTDDLEDGLSSDLNRPTLQLLLESLFALARRKNVAPIILTGDIHAAGMTEILHRNETSTLSIPQIVASPIAHEPMPKTVGGFTTTTSEMELARLDGGRLWARNIFYVSKRNFAVIRLKRPADERPVEFHFEGHELPVALNLDFRPQ